MKVTDILFYGGARQAITHLGLSSLFIEILEIIFKTKIFLLEEKNANSAQVVREKLYQTFKAHGNWKKGKAGEIDWMKKLKFNETIVVIVGVEVQVSARSDLLIRDIVHLRNHIRKGKINLGVIIVPSERMQKFLPDRTPSIKDAIRYIEDEFKEAMEMPLVVIGIEHDGPSDKPLPKKKTRG
ncbi:MAG TPA: hypothetical protein EYP81_02935 [Thermodesulfobacteriaceae bacterium]|nr:hypothetical protein [Thermodesulfobacteriaceae bacterium]